MIEEVYPVDLLLDLQTNVAHELRQWLHDYIGKWNQDWYVKIPENPRHLQLIFRSREDLTQFVLAWGQECLVTH